MNIKKYYLWIFIAVIVLLILLSFSVFYLSPSPLAIIIPNIAYIYFFWSIVIDKPIPKKYMIIALVLWLFAIIWSAFCQVILGIILKPVLNSNLLGIFNTIFVAPFTEEFLKWGVILWVYFICRKSFSITHWFIYAWISAFIFAMWEQLLFSITWNSEGIVTFWENQYFISTIYFWLSHWIMTWFIALACAKASLHNSLKVKKWLPWGWLFVAILFHWIFNFSIVYDWTHGDMKTPVITSFVYISMLIIFVFLYMWIINHKKICIIKK